MVAAEGSLEQWESRKGKARVEVGPEGIRFLPRLDFEELSDAAERGVWMREKLLVSEDEKLRACKVVLKGLQLVAILAASKVDAGM